MLPIWTRGRQASMTVQPTNGNGEIVRGPEEDCVSLTVPDQPMERNKWQFVGSAQAVQLGGESAGPWVT